MNYEDIDDHTKEDIEEAIIWAKERLKHYEGSGHQIFVTACGDDLVSCSFAKPEWPGDFCGSGMDHAAEAIVMAVCEYLNGK